MLLAIMLLILAILLAHHPFNFLTPSSGLGASASEKEVEESEEEEQQDILIIPSEDDEEDADGI